MRLEDVSRSTVLVRCSTESAGTQVDEYMSGLLFEPRLVLCSGLLLRNAQDSTSLNDDHRFTVFAHTAAFKKYLPRHVSEMESRVSASATSSGETVGVYAGRPSVAQISASVARRFKDAQLADLLSKILSDWTLGDARQEDGEDKDMRRTLDFVSIFLVLELQPANRPNNVGSAVDVDKALRKLLKSCLSPDIAPASRLAGGGIPFGSSAFLGSLSTGILSAVVGDPPLIALTDLRAAPGSEGGPVFGDADALDSGPGSWRPFGLVLLPVSWCRGEWVGFTILATLRPLIHNALHGSGGLLPRPVNGTICDTVFCPCRWPPTSNSRPHPLAESVLLVRCGTMWGSGVVVSATKRVVVTCAHVLQQAPRHAVKVVWSNNEAVARINFRSTSDQPFDLAVLTVGGSAPLKELKLRKDPPRTGEAVLAAGFPLLSERPQRRRRHPEPILSAGTLTVAPDKPSLLLSSCCVQAGSSGGALICRRSGEVVGVTVSNTQASGAVHPSVNMAVPVSVLSAALTAFLKTGDESALDPLCSKDPDVSRQWVLQPPRRCHL